MLEMSIAAAAHVRPARGELRWQEVRSGQHGRCRKRPEVVAAADESSEQYQPRANTP
jgi:hypothetical protein